MILAIVLIVLVILFVLEYIRILRENLIKDYEIEVERVITSDDEEV